MLCAGRPIVDARGGVLGMAVAGPNRGGMDVSSAPGGAAGSAGPGLGEVRLAIDGRSVGSQNTRPAFVGPDRIGGAIELKSMDEGASRSTNQTIAARPAE